MSASAVITTQNNALTAVTAELVTNAVTSEHTKRAYRRALYAPDLASQAKVMDFLTWYLTTQQDVLNKATVNAYVTYLRSEGTTASSINQRLVAIRKLACEAADNGLD